MCEICEASASLDTVVLRGPVSNAFRVAMDEVVRPNAARQERVWKLFLPLPRLFLHRLPSGGNDALKSKVVQRFDDFASGLWAALLAAATKCDEDDRTAHNRTMRRTRPDDLQLEAEKNSQWCTSASQQVGKTWRAQLLVREFARIRKFCAAGCSCKGTSST